MNRQDRIDGEAPGANPHAGHRARMKARVEREGAQSLSPHEILEWLLYYVIPRRDVNRDAHALLDAGGTVEGALLNASKAGSPRVSGFLRQVGECAAYYGEHAGDERPRLSDIDWAAYPGGLWAFCTDGADRVLYASRAQDTAGILKGANIVYASGIALVRTDGAPLPGDRAIARELSQAVAGGDGMTVRLYHINGASAPVPEEI